MADGCGAPAQTATPADIDTKGQVVLAGKVTGTDGPIGGAFVRLLDRTGEFTAEVVASGTGDYRFFAAPGDWTVRAPTPGVSSKSGKSTSPLWPSRKFRDACCSSLASRCA